MYDRTLLVVTLGIFASVCNVDGLPSDYLGLLKDPEKFEERNDIKSAIIGGNEVYDGQITYQVSLRRARSNQHFCGGSILNSKWILTAAHCVVTNGHVLSATAFVVFAGSADLTKNGYRQNVNQIVVSPNYNKIEFKAKSDIALLKLSNSLPMGNKLITAVTLPRRSYPVGTVCTVSGWGFTELTKSPTQLKILQTKTMNFDKCLATYNSYYVDSTNFCSKNIEGTGVCSGDSGGPLVVFENNIPVQIGIVSAGQGNTCAIRPIDAYVDVRQFLGFINANIKNM